MNRREKVYEKCVIIRLSDIIEMISGKAFVKNLHRF